MYTDSCTVLFLPLPGALPLLQLFELVKEHQLGCASVQQRATVTLTNGSKTKHKKHGCQLYLSAMPLEVQADVQAALADSDGEPEQAQEADAGSSGGGSSGGSGGAGGTGGTGAGAASEATTGQNGSAEQPGRSSAQRRQLLRQLLQADSRQVEASEVSASAANAAAAAAAARSSSRVCLRSSSSWLLLLR
jgi:hypothetical protein